MFDLSNISAPNIDVEPLPIAYSYSDTQFEILIKYIKDFEDTLDSEHKVGLILTNFGQSITIIDKEPDRPKRTIGFVIPEE